MMAGMAAAILAAISFFPLNVRAISAQSAIVMDADTGTVLYEKNADRRGLIASTTKIMTALIVCENCNVLDRVVIPREAAGIEGSSMYLKAGEVFTVQELLYGMMLRSGNDAAAALAIHCGGTIDHFAELMNDKCRELGLTGTHFTNPHGLDGPEHYSCARDLGVLAAAAMKNPLFRQTVGTKTVLLGGQVLRNHNKLLWQMDGAEGIKTGYTKAAGRILVSSTRRGGRRLIAVTMNAPDDWQDHKTLVDAGFSRYRAKQPVTQGQVIGTVSVAGGTEVEVPLIAGKDFVILAAEQERITVALPEPGFVYAPVIQGQQAGTACIYVDGWPAGTVPVYYGRTAWQKP